MQMEKLGIDPASIDPKRILASIAADPSAAGAARVAACRLLLQFANPDGKTDHHKRQHKDAVIARTLRLLDGGRA